MLLSNNFESFGLDIGDRSLKAAYVKKRGSTPTLVSHGTMYVPAGVLEQGQIKKPDELSLLLKRLLKNVNGKTIKTPYVHACLPETHTFIKLLTLTVDNAGELPALVREELPNHIPLPPDELYIDWQVVERAAANQNKILVGAVPKTVAESFTACLAAAGLAAASLQIEAEAIARALLPQADLPKTSIAMVDIGATRSSFICFDRGSIQFTVSLDLAGDKITDLIKNKLNLTWDEAERAKRICGLNRQAGEGIIMDLVREEVSALSEAIVKNITYYAEHFPGGGAITSIILCGGGARLPNFKETLEAKLPNIRVYQGNPLINLIKNLKNVVRRHQSAGPLNFLEPDMRFEPVKIKEPLPPAAAVTYTTAIGLALSNTES